MIKIEFSKEDFEFCHELGLKRSGSVGHADTKNSPRMVHGSRYRHYLGVVGELAYSKYSGLEVDIHTIGKGDDGTDFPNGVNVKCSDAKNKPNLLILSQQFKRKYSDYYVMVWYTQGDVYLLGWATRDQLYTHKKVVDFGYGETYLYSNRNLKPMNLIPV